jgi:hypothetical protein
MFLVLVVEPVEKCIVLAIPLKTEFLDSKLGCGRDCGKSGGRTRLGVLVRGKRDGLGIFSTADLALPVENRSEFILNQQLDC